MHGSASSLEQRSSKCIMEIEIAMETELLGLNLAKKIFCCNRLRGWCLAC